ncbi:MAG TPA: TetR family transcriptional regulator C-terminal domain-containing protein [Gemmatimonadaceae bacterium]|nr:TetR family transcriptional regulator C-terminal domain-containing protein [Gemmatimonadaceae bacterium]
MDRPIGLVAEPQTREMREMHETKRRLIMAGLQLMLERGYNGVGIQDLLVETGVPKGSFYHHFESKEDFALQVLDAYVANAHALLDATLSDTSRPPLERVRNFFEGVRASYAEQGYLGCFMGALGQELSGASEIFRHKVEGCVGAIAARLALCLEEARSRGDLPGTTDPVQMANVLVDAWEGAAFRTRLVRNGRPLEAVLDFYFAAVTAR